MIPAHAAPTAPELSPDEIANCPLAYRLVWICHPNHGSPSRRKDATSTRAPSTLRTGGKHIPRLRCCASRRAEANKRRGNAKCTETPWAPCAPLRSSRSGPWRSELGFAAAVVPLPSMRRAWTPAKSSTTYNTHGRRAINTSSRGGSSAITMERRPSPSGPIYLKGRVRVLARDRGFGDKRADAMEQVSPSERLGPQQTSRGIACHRVAQCLCRRRASRALQPLRK